MTTILHSFEDLKLALTINNCQLSIRNVLLAVMVTALTGCSPRMKSPSLEPAARAAEKAVKDQEARDAKRQGAVEGEGISVVWQEKLPGGGVKKVVEAHAVTGRLNAKNKTSLLNEATGILYKENVARANFKAPTVKGDENKHTVIATGGVTMTSIEPPGITVTSKRLIWYANEDKIVAEGDVRFTRILPGENKLWGRGGPFERAVFDTGLNQWSLQ